MASLLPVRPVDRAVLLLAMAILAVHQWVHRDFFIDDAAICFAFARNIVNGEGIVPWPGGERIESFSNPTWMVILTAFQALGLDGFTVAKPLAAGIGMATALVTWRVARLAIPEDAGPAALFAPLTLAFSAQFAIWSASGLENALWSLLLALAIERTVVDGRSGRFLGAALAWLLVAWTRPEGALYAAVGLVYFGWMSLRRDPTEGWRRIGAWAAVVAVPSLALEALRYWYFAWPLPNTYYAKLVVRETHPLQWDARGWSQAREFAGRLWHGYLFPVYFLGLLGRNERARNAILVALVLLVLPPPEAIAVLPPFPESWLFLRLVVIALGLVGLPLVAERDAPGFEARALCWSSAAVTVLFSVYASGDWMGGYRWMSLMVVPLSVLFAAGTWEIVQLVEARVAPLLAAVPRPGEAGWSTMSWLTAALLVGAWIPPNLAQSKDHRNFNTDETAPRIIARSQFTDAVRKRVFYEGEVNNLEMDQGGMIWEHPDYDQLDMASLVDISMGRHTYEQRAFIEEYVFAENRPTFGHVHGWWAKFSGFETYPEWSDYFRLPPNQELPPPRPPHTDGMWADRRLILARDWPGEKRPVGFGPVVLHGVTVPVDLWPRGGDGFLEIGLSSPPRPGGDLRLVVLLLPEAGPVAASWEVPVGYGLLAMDQWRADEVFVGRFALPVPATVAPGDYHLGVVVLGPKGAVWVPTRAPEGVLVGTAADARYAIGEVRYPDVVHVGAPAEVDARAAEIRARALELAGSGKCAVAEGEWIREKRARPRAWDQHEAELPAVARPIADCWAKRAEAEPEQAAEWLARAHRWDHRSAELARVGGPVGERLWAEGLRARASADPEGAYRAFTALLGFQPWRAWARRYAEEARDERLGLGTGALGVGGATPPAGDP